MVLRTADAQDAAAFGATTAGSLVRWLAAEAKRRLRTQLLRHPPLACAVGTLDTALVPAPDTGQEGDGPRVVTVHLQQCV